MADQELLFPEEFTKRFVRPHGVNAEVSRVRGKIFINKGRGSGIVDTTSSLSLRPLVSIARPVANKSSERDAKGQLIGYGQRIMVSVSHVAFLDQPEQDPCIGRLGRARELEQGESLRPDRLRSACVRGRAVR